MKRSIKVTLLFIFVFFCLNLDVFATSKYLVLQDAVNIRKGPGTNYSRIELGKVGSTYNLNKDELVNDENIDGSCDSGWYEVTINDETGYVCSEYAKVVDNSQSENDNKEPSNTCEVEMANAGFPSSYWSDLCSLKEKHSNWTFKAINTNLEWQTVVTKESSCGKSLVISSNSDYLDSSCSKKEGSFKAASQKAVAFYMDPRNFLTEQYIFQFEYLKYEESLSTSYETAINKMLANAEFYKYHTGNGIDFAKETSAAGKEMDINPISLASRMYQELGVSTSLYTLYSGLYEEYEKAYLGYYNFYNIGVTGSCTNNLTYCGLDYAKKKGWNTPYNAIKGGATLLANNYLANNQHTLYLQKFNIAPKNESTLYINQYMTNIAAPSSESTTTYKTYKNMELLDSAFIFYIPVFNNMSATISNNESGADNTTSSSPSSPTISEEEENKLSPNAIITSSGFKYSGNNITGINPESTVESIKNGLESVGGENSVVIKNNKGNTVESGNIGTGFTITITGKSKETYNVLIYGDISGDSNISSLDLLLVQRHLLKTDSLENVYNKAADVNKDGKITSLDLLLVQRHILKTESIKQ